VHLAIIGGGPAGNTAATVAATLGARVTVIERDLVGGAAHLWDCVPSKAMIATGAALADLRRAPAMGLDASGQLDIEALRARVAGIEDRLRADLEALLDSQQVRTVHGSGRLFDANTVEVETTAGTEHVEADAILLATGSRPRVPEWAPLDGERVMTTRDAYPPKEMPSHLVVVGSGVTGVEFTHMFRSLGAEVTLLVSRQHVLPLKDAEVAAELEAEFERRGVKLLKGARADSIRREADSVEVRCEDGRIVTGSHVVLAIGSEPNTDGLGLAEVGIEVDDAGYVAVNRHCQTNLKHIYAAGDISGKLPLSSVAAIQGRKIAEHVMGLYLREHRHLDYDKAASAIFTDPEIADVGLAEADAFAQGRKVRVTKVPFSTSAKALIDGDDRGFVKVISDPATGVVLGGSIVGTHAAELISVLAVAVTNGLHVGDIVDSMLVHPALAEAITEAAS
jgi:dihydrolipoamide dehydrogenase